jgi:hypothetical protein
MDVLVVKDYGPRHRRWVTSQNVFADVTEFVVGRADGHSQEVTFTDVRVHILYFQV